MAASPKPHASQPSTPTLFIDVENGLDQFYTTPTPSPSKRSRSNMFSPTATFTQQVSEPSSPLLSIDTVPGVLDQFYTTPTPSPSEHPRRNLHSVFGFGSPRPATCLAPVNAPSSESRASSGASSTTSTADSATTATATDSTNTNGAAKKASEQQKDGKKEAIHRKDGVAEKVADSNTSAHVR